MNREDKVHRAIVKQKFHEKVHASYVAFVFQPRTAFIFAGILLGVAFFTGSLRVTGLAASGLFLCLVVFYIVWFSSMYFVAYIWTTIVRFFVTMGKAKKY